MNKNIQKIFNIKPSHFKNGWAFFDAMSRKELALALEIGCKLVPNGHMLKTTILMRTYPEFMCFGKVNKEGEIMIEGITGYPSNDVCLRIIDSFYPDAKKKKIDPSYVYVEW